LRNAIGTSCFQKTLYINSANMLAGEKLGDFFMDPEGIAAI
jgi:hypothetical protein